MTTYLCQGDVQVNPDQNIFSLQIDPFCKSLDVQLFKLFGGGMEEAPGRSSGLLDSRWKEEHPRSIVVVNEKRVEKLSHHWNGGEWSETWVMDDASNGAQKVLRHASSLFNTIFDIASYRSFPFSSRRRSKQYTVRYIICSAYFWKPARCCSNPQRRSKP